jgi:Transposase
VDPGLDRFYHWSDGVRVAELSRLARTVRTWEVEILAFHATDGCSNGPTEAEPADQESQAGRAWLPQLRQLQAAAAPAPRRQVADAPNRETARPLTTFRGIEPYFYSRGLNTLTPTDLGRQLRQAIE